ncbi:AGC/NDR protein kinase [Apiospora kogelbergensis]|uniref:non-specific serine/threonine protein kinase n=1 Tax=Apiospora kogelbergensis TaxID=1337665 RepID=A0AAW0QTI4_9PEZI
MKRNTAALRSPPSAQADSQTLESSSSMSAAGEPPRKLRRQGSRIRSVLRSLTNSASGTSLHERASPQPNPPPYEREDNTNSSGKYPGHPIETTVTPTTSLDSKVSHQETNSAEKKSKTASVLRREVVVELASSPDSTLEPIEETALDQLCPTVLTVEKASAAKIYLETYFNEMLTKNSPREMRLQLLEADLWSRRDELSPPEKDYRRRLFYKQETDHLRETRALKAKSTSVMKGIHNELADNYEVLKILGKGSFGVVRLVKEKADKGFTNQTPSDKKPVYAMKVIRKSAMLRTSQEGHLRAERDFLVSSEGSRWIVPLIASFQDPANLYLIMEYMPGGDFLGLLIRENILNEPVAKFFIAEMILCIEEAHSLRWIHRDIKPDNFLVSATGHLKISDFGLAFDGHWSHDTSYYHTHRYSLVHSLGLTIEGNSVDRSEGFQGTLK